MERRHFLKLAFGFAAGGVALAATAQAAPLLPQPLAENGKFPPNPDLEPAVTSEAERLQPEEVRWGRGRRGFGRRGWGRRGWGRPRWRRRRVWGWRRRRWRRRRYLRRRYW